ncbi:dTMP kinase [Candidatus Gottesmanbacteria bacterium RIFCSPLOWO2_01_FULL_49_10]|uniref:Thymidylate kinase n=1 Tax=Candidatus Gottesmanbacteria bacterium RIFCSPLOWO2_01_FULL_49_10 TaxID=1798396 RepID=A0A1F6AYV4_9BACT|nr:MAG: dTMP kinase [Candidatus Gottesmanbacteria bacterium RIFCSPLOWO2_01_FULL_49_10]
MQGKLIVFEGISGTGKETQARLLHRYLLRRGIKSHVVFHPSPELKEVLSQWRKTRKIDHVSESYFLLADRYNRVVQVIKPAIKRGEWVICLRNSLSALVYQGKTKDERAWIAREFARFEPEADLLFFFDITPEAAMARIMKRHKETGEALGKFETLGHLAQKRVAYQTVLKSMTHIRIDARQSIEDIHNRIIASLG